jgi:phage shock protein PspC (stress-responsive transcriptional regulator)
MGLAFLTGAVASGFTAAGLTALLIWVATVLAGSSDPWSIAPWLVTLIAALVAVGTYVAEGIAHRKTLARMRSTGEPWAYREG